LSFLQEHKDQRIIFDIKDYSTLTSVDMTTFDMLLDNGVTNWVLRLPSLFDDKTIPLDDYLKLKEKKIPMFFNDYIDRWDILWGYMQLEVSDIYICNELGFELDKIYPIFQEQRINLRVIPNKAQSAWFQTPDAIQFFIRPEDIKRYEKFVDVFELYEEDYAAPNTGTVLYQVYAENQTWMGELKEIISGLNSNINGQFLYPQFGEKRMRCGKKCLKGGGCRMCYTVFDLEDSMKQAGIYVGEKKKANDQKPFKSPVKMTKEEEAEILEKIKAEIAQEEEN